MVFLFERIKTFITSKLIIMKKFTICLLTALVCATSVFAQDPNGTPGATGTVNGTYRGADITYKTVRAKDGWVWLQQNIGSGQVSTSSTDAASYGDLFQWGRWDDGHQVRTPGNTMNSHAVPNNPSGLNLGGDNPFYHGGGITWYTDGTVGDKWNAATTAAVTATNGCDPCKQIFVADWQVPSLADWQAMLGAEQVTNLATGFASNLKLSAAGTRNELLGTLGDEGIIGIYWSSTAEIVTPSQARYINLYTSNLNDYHSRGIGMSMRCLKKSLPTSIKEREVGADFKLYPNPANAFMTVSFDKVAQDGILTVKDVLGKNVFQTSIIKGTTSYSLDLSSFSDGMYFLSADGEGKAFMVKH